MMILFWLLQKFDNVVEQLFLFAEVTVVVDGVEQKEASDEYRSSYNTNTENNITK